MGCMYMLIWAKLQRVAAEFVVKAFPIGGIEQLVTYCFNISFTIGGLCPIALYALTIVVLSIATLDIPNIPFDKHLSFWFTMTGTALGEFLFSVIWRAVQWAVSSYVIGAFSADKFDLFAIRLVQATVAMVSLVPIIVYIIRDIMGQAERSRAMVRDYGRSGASNG